MQKELEVKVINNNILEIEDFIKNNTIDALRDLEQENIIFRGNKNKEGYFRLRIEKDKINNKEFLEFTFKELVENKNIKENIEYNIDIKHHQLDTFISLLDIMGYKEVARFNKKRSRYTYMGNIFDFDEVSYKDQTLNYFEIELRKEDDLKKILLEFDISQDDIVKESVLDLLNIPY